MVPSRTMTCLLRASRAQLVHVTRPAFYSSQCEGRFYTKKHEWVSVNGDIGTVGISDYAQEALGEVVFAQLPVAGRELTAGEECGALESVKAAGEVYTPVSGTVTEKNENVEASPALVNSSCFEQGWLFRVRLRDTAELQPLMDQRAYDKFLEESH